MTTFTRRDALSAGCAVVTGGVAGCLDDEGDLVFAEGFEAGLDGWDRDAAIGPEVDLSEFEWEIGVTDERASEGDHSLSVFTEGRYDDGTAWIERPVELPAADRYEVRLDAWSESESFNTLRHLVAYLGPDRPEVEEDFPEPGRNSTNVADTAFGGLREPLHRAEGWEEYRFVWDPVETPTEAVLAVGVSVVWEADATHFLDDLRVRTVG